MEFEKQTFRFHQRVFERPCTKYCLLSIGFISFCNLAFGCFNIYLMHSNFLNQNHILKPLIEKQLKPMFYHQYDILNLENKNIDILFDHIN